MLPSREYAAPTRLNNKAYVLLSKRVLKKRNTPETDSRKPSKRRRKDTEQAKDNHTSEAVRALICYIQALMPLQAPDSDEEDRRVQEDYAPSLAVALSDVNTQLPQFTSVVQDPVNAPVLNSPDASNALGLSIASSHGASPHDSRKQQSPTTAVNVGPNGVTSFDSKVIPPKAPNPFRSKRGCPPGLRHNPQNARIPSKSSTSVAAPSDPVIRRRHSTAIPSSESGLSNVHSRTVPPSDPIQKPNNELTSMVAPTAIVRQRAESSPEKPAVHIVPAKAVVMGRPQSFASNIVSPRPHREIKSADEIEALLKKSHDKIMELGAKVDFQTSEQARLSMHLLDEAHHRGTLEQHMKVQFHSLTEQLQMERQQRAQVEEQLRTREEELRTREEQLRTREEQLQTRMLNNEQALYKVQADFQAMMDDIKRTNEELTKVQSAIVSASGPPPTLTPTLIASNLTPLINSILLFVQGLAMVVSNTCHMIVFRRSYACFGSRDQRRAPTVKMVQ
jgi:hypothetical protein